MLHCSRREQRSRLIYNVVYSSRVLSLLIGMNAPVRAPEPQSRGFRFSPLEEPRRDHDVIGQQRSFVAKQEWFHQMNGPKMGPIR